MRPPRIAGSVFGRSFAELIDLARKAGSSHVWHVAKVLLVRMLGEGPELSSTSAPAWTSATLLFDVSSQLSSYLALGPGCPFEGRFARPLTSECCFP